MNQQETEQRLGNLNIENLQLRAQVRDLEKRLRSCMLVNEGRLDEITNLKEELQECRARYA